MSGPAEALQPFGVSRETLARLEAFAALLTEENERQNLVSKASLDQLWSRHIADSAQLLRFAPDGAGTWIDLGTGAGFPGLIVAALRELRVTLVEARKLRVEFLRHAAGVLGVADRVDIVCARAEGLEARPFDIISARAFAPLDKLLMLGERFSRPGTIWLLPKGRNAKSELDAARGSWQGDFRLEPSLTDADASIIVAREVSRKGKGKRAR
jgi:16S rRNA (guanine527-N7)-methyltransferase